jgi:hypothetical protein
LRIGPSAAISSRILGQRGELTNPPSQSDLDAWQENFGNVANPVTAALTGVPEPSSIVLLLVVFTFSLTRRRML